MEILMSAQALQWIGCVVGLSGALMLATKNSFSGYGFVLFLVSNMFWIAFGFVTNAPGLVVMQIGFSVTSAIGVWRWVVGPWLDRRYNERTLPRGMYYVKNTPVMRQSKWRRA